MKSSLLFRAGLLGVFSFFFFSLSLYADGGCTDSTACNFDSKATFDDGSCVYNEQEIIAMPDLLCVQDGETFTYNVLDNDGVCDGIQVQVTSIGDDPCFFIDPSGNIRAIPGAQDCCGDHVLSYRICDSTGLICSETEVNITVKCPKPDCSLIDLSDYTGGTDPVAQQESHCLHVCELSETTLFVPYNNGLSYTWTVLGGVYTAGVNDAEIIVTWGSAGAGSVILETEDANGIKNTYVICIDIMDGPTAGFTSSGYVCLGQQICFTNSSLNADAYFWDFGDGGTSVMENPCYNYALPGTFTVVLYAYKYNFDEKGNPLCCCVDTFEMDVEVDPLPGPDIYWVSTLCQGDSSKYWTDATNCSSYVWTVLDANGDTIPFIGQGNDTICVTWAIGPVGTITLDVSGCDSAYCNNPTTVSVPVIPAISQITGPIEVCEYETKTYSLPKWLGTTYLWTVTGGVVVSGDSTHIASIQWGPAGVGTIHVDYFNPFLAGLPGHEYPDCYGSADLTVLIKPAFTLNNYGPSLVCVGDLSTVYAFGTPLPICNWTITPSVPFTNLGGHIDVVWPAVGTYVIEAIPTDTTIYCNDKESVVIKVTELAPPTGIDGPLEICPGDTSYYTVQTAASGVGFNWTATNGVLSSPNGATVGVVWGPSGPYVLSVYQQMQSAPGCVSTPISITVDPKLLIGPMAVSGTAACTNSLSSYSLSPAQHPDAQINWSINTPTSGSIVGGQNTANISVQWNNDPGMVTVTAEVSLCGDTVLVNLTDTLYSPIVPVITQVGILCPGVSAVLQAGAGFVSYSWSTGDTTDSTVVSSPGMYSVTTQDIHGCSATTYYQVSSVPGPTAAISSGDNPLICIPSPHPVTLVAQTNPNLEFEWFCNSVSQGPSSPVSTFLHPFQGVIGTYTYYVVVTDITTGCMNTSLPFNVYESDCPPVDCNPEPYTLSIAGVNQFPACNTVDFTLTSTNFTLASWYFGDGNSSGVLNPSHAYTQAGCYNVIVEGTVPDVNGIDACLVKTETSVCVPIAAEFDFDYVTCTQVDFTDFSTYIVGPGNAITSWSWNFSVGTSSLPNPTFVFPGPGNYPVTLTVANSNGCTATITHNVVVNSVGLPVISVLPSPVCAGVASNFSAPASGAVTWFWDFGDGATFTGPAPQHSYLVGGSYTVTVTVSDPQGCQETATLNLTVFSAVPPAVITAVPGLIICEGDSTTLSAPPGYSYLWTNGATSQSILVGAGTYGVILTDGNGCKRTLASVTVVELPAPQVAISGNLVICDDGCTLLSSAYDPTLTYQWFDNGVAIPFATSSQLSVCDYNLAGPYSLEVTNAIGCSNLSASVSVLLAVSPNFVVNVSPNNCAGTPSTLAVSPVQSGVIYAWSTGDIGASIVTSQAGTYFVIGTDTLTGCSGSASGIIHELPDFCALPAGCYETCNPDTICGPLGLSSYQWNMNGAILPGETGPCLTITTSGSYNLTATNQWGCSATSDSLYLVVLNCDSVSCDLLDVDFSYLIDAGGEQDSCCVSLSYTNNYGPYIQGFTIHSSDTEFNWDLGSLDPSLAVQSIGTNNISLDNVVAGSPLPSGVLNNFLSFCLKNVVNTPQIVVIDWYDFENQIVCSDTLQFACPIEPPCLYVLEQSIYCLEKQTVFEFTVCNPASALENIGFINFLPVGPAGIVLSPPNIDISGSPISPGTCQTFQILLSGPLLGGEVFCYNLVAHTSDPEIDPTGFCCSLDTTYCIDIPYCDPCDLVMIEDVLPSSGDAGCCYTVSLNNGYDAAYFDEIAVCMISPSTTFIVNNPFGSGWNTSGYTPTSVSFIPDAGTGGFVPLGVVALPEICVTTNVAPSQYIEIKWMSGGVVVCRDTISVFCEPPCGYLYDEQILCENGSWVYTASIKNTADYVVQEAVIFFNDTLLSAYNSTIAIGPLNPGSSFGPISLPIGAPAQAGDTICFTVTIHEISPEGIYLSCCNFTQCIVLPDCYTGPPCVCDESFVSSVEAGIDCVPSGVNPYAFSFSPLIFDYFQQCDAVSWQWGDGSPSSNTVGAGVITHVFPGPGSYTVCMKVVRTDINGKQCYWKVCKTVVVNDVLVPAINVFPNPTTGRFNLQFADEAQETVRLNIYDNTGRPVDSRSYYEVKQNASYSIDLGEKNSGVYYLIFQVGNDMQVKKLVLY